ncbi:MAG TPA: molybdopterin-binding oxidoreductase, partial [Acidimicrobiaceae bacterium]|nr:molybdopterin-binding oxidoreductase [Acidimicrobiaceae bacterium]
MTDDDRPTPRRSLDWFGAGAGALAAGVSIALGELVDGINTDVPSMVVAAGELVINYTPGDVVAASIENLGAWQKPALLAGITVFIVLLGAVAGRAAARGSHAVSLGLFALLGALGGWSAARNQMSPALGSWITGIAAAVLGVAVLYAILSLAGFSRPVWGTATLRPLAAGRRRSARDVRALETFNLTRGDLEMSHAAAGPGPTGLASRRGFLAYAGAGATALALIGIGHQLRAASLTDKARKALALPPVGPAAGRTPAGATATTLVPQQRSLMRRAAGLDTLDAIDRVTPYLTPNIDFYRIDTALVAPEVNPANWQLEIDGMVENPFSLSLDDIYAMELRDEAVTLSCVSNPVGGDLVGNAVWTGVPLADLLERAGVAPDADQLVGRSVDHWTAGFPTAAVGDGRTAMLAIGMNGEPLPVRHGFPARLVVAGLYGYVSAVKWINRITLTTWDGFDGYWVPRGWSKEGPVKTQSRIDVPTSRDPLTAGTPAAVAGVAWAPTRGIAGVEVQIDDDRWQECRIGGSLGDETWVQWVYDWTPTAGEHRIRVRATDGAGETQGSDPVPPRPDGAEGWNTVTVRV